MSEIKDIPVGWAVEKLDNFAIYQKGKKPKLVSDSKTDICFMPYVNIKAFEKGIVDEYTDGDKCTLCKDGDFFDVWDGARAGYIGKAIKGALGSTLVKINFPGILNEYAYQFLVSKYLQINTNTKGTGIPHVDPNILWNYKFPIPPLAEQQRIVAKIEELFSSLDKGIESLKTAQAQLKVYRQAVLKYAFEGKLTNKNIPEGELPEGWVKTELAKITEKVEKVKLKEKNPNEEFIYLDIGGIDNKLNKISNHKVYAWKDAPSRAQQIVKVGDTIFSTVRTYLKNIAFIDKVQYENQICSSGFSVIRANKNKSISKYLYYYSIFEDFIRALNNLQKGTSYPAIRSEDIFTQFINLPPSLTEQTQIVQEIENRLSICDTIEENIRISLLKAEALRQSILKKAFEGTLVAQDPNDEPASVLLEKIRVEKEKNQPIKQDQAKKGTK